MEKESISVLDDLDSDEAVAEDPGRIKTVLVPKVQNMDNYLLRHYKSYIIQELNKRLVDGEISEIVGTPVKSDRIVPGECCFRRFNYWQLNQCDFLIDIDLRLELRVETPAGLDTDFFSFYVELWFSFCADDDEECTLVAQKGHFPPELPISQYPEKFVRGWLMHNWSQVVAAIEANPEHVPF